MELFAAVTGRRSIRRFKPDPVPDALIRDILEKARWAPSWANTQPWEVTVITGEALDRFRQENRRYCISGQPHGPEIPMPTQWPGHQDERRRQLGKQVLDSLSIAREDKEARKNYNADVFSLFGAPCLVLVCVDKGLPLEYAMLDVGLFMQTFCLLAHGEGLGTCMLAASVRYPQILREQLKIPENRIMAIGTACGYPDAEAPINRFPRERAPLKEWFTPVS